MSRQVEEIAVDVERLRDCLESLIAWMAQSANSPISTHEAELLLKKLLPAKGKAHA